MSVELLRGTLDMLVLKALTQGPLHGYGIARWLERVTSDALSIEEGSLYPALRRLIQRGRVVAEWGVSDNNRRARYYTLSRKGRAQLEEQVAAWERFKESSRRCSMSPWRRVVGACEGEVGPKGVVPVSGDALPSCHAKHTMIPRVRQACCVRVGAPHSLARGGL